MTAMHQPAFILVRPQLGENIGKTARAMLNFALTQMVLVEPRDGWPNPAAGPAASGADTVLDQAKIVADVETAVAPYTRVFATTVRERGMAKPVVTAAEAMAETRREIAAGGRVAVLFGPERAGLTNDDVALADTILTIPVNPAFGSVNLAQAAILVAYEWFNGDQTAAPALQDDRPGQRADKDQLQQMFDQLEQALAARGYFRSEGRRDTQTRSLRTLLQNAGLTAQEVQTLRGVFKTLTWRARSSDGEDPAPPA